MLAILALGRRADEERIALMARPAHAVHGVLADEISAVLALDGEQLVGARGWLVLGVAIDGNLVREFGAIADDLIGHARALFASGMGALLANLVAAEAGLAAVALTMHAQAMLLLHPLGRGSAAGALPLAIF